MFPRSTIGPIFIQKLSYGSSRGRGSGKGGGGGGSIVESGGKFGEMGAAKEDEYFHKLVRYYFNKHLIVFSYKHL